MGLTSEPSGGLHLKMTVTGFRNQSAFQLISLRGQRRARCGLKDAGVAHEITEPRRVHLHAGAVLQASGATREAQRSFIQEKGQNQALRAAAGHRVPPRPRDLTGSRVRAGLRSSPSSAAATPLPAHKPARPLALSPARPTCQRLDSAPGGHSQLHSPPSAATCDLRPGPAAVGT